MESDIIRRALPWSVVLFFLLALFLAVSAVVYVIAFRSPNRKQNNDYNIAHTSQLDPLRETISGMIARLNEIPYESVSCPSDDGLTLRGRYYHRKDGAPVMICFHGYRGTPSRDFAGGTAMYLEQGFNLLMVEQRAHCGSEGHTITLGVRERHDCLVWIDYIRWRFDLDTPILLAGISMGATTVLMASGLELPENVRGIIADCPYTSPKEILLRVCANRGIPPRIVYPFLWLGALVYGRFRLTAADASEAVKRAKAPILLIHGEDDRFVPCDMGRRIAEANPEKIEFHTFPQAGHGLSYLIDQPRYEQIVRSFLAKALSRETSHT